MKNEKRTGKKPAEQLLLGLAAIALTVFTTSPVIADEDMETEESYYENPAQAQAARASQLAEEAALTDDDVQQAYNDYQDAVDDLESEEPTEAELANIQVLEDAYQDKLSEATGTISEDIKEKREEGKGWGEIAIELGVHPSALGLGHTKGLKDFSDSEIAEATARDTGKGLSGHGAGLHSGVTSSNQGLGKSQGKGPGKSTAGLSGAAEPGSGKNSASAGRSGGPGNSSGPGSSGSSNAGGNKGGNSGSAGDNGGRGGSNAGGNSGGNGGGNSGGNGGGNSGGNGGGGGGGRR